MSRSERIAKYNQLLRIEEKLGEQARFSGKKFLQKVETVRHGLMLIQRAEAI